jgi:hypothetical protein
MSRNPINEGIGMFMRPMDVMTIDANRLQIPSAGVRAKSRIGRGVDVRFITESRREPISDPPIPVIGASHRDDVVIDIRPRSEPKPSIEMQVLLDTPPYVVPAGYFIFCLALALCNLIQPTMSHAVCIALSPLPMICILAHSVGIQPVWIGWGLVLCGWLLPSVCALWSVGYGVGYLVCMAVFAVAGCRRPIPFVCLLVVIVCSLLALFPHWTGVESKLWITVVAFFATLTCAASYVGGGKIVYRIKNNP